MLYRDCIAFCKNCAECVMVSGSGRVQRPPLHPIPVQKPFQIMGVDNMELPVTEGGNKYVCHCVPGFLDEVANGVSSP